MVHKPGLFLQFRSQDNAPPIAGEEEAPIAPQSADENDRSTSTMEALLFISVGGIAIVFCVCFVILLSKGRRSDSESGLSEEPEEAHTNRPNQPNRREFRPVNGPRYQKADFLTPAESQFAKTLCQATAARWHLMAKIRLADLVRVSDPDDTAGFNRVACKHVDFLLCDLKSLQPVLVVELDDASHERSHRRERDSFVDAALASVGLTVVRFKVASHNDPTTLAARLSNALAPASETGNPKPCRGPVIPTTDELRRQMQEKLADLPRH